MQYTPFTHAISAKSHILYLPSLSGDHLMEKQTQNHKNRKNQRNNKPYQIPQKIVKSWNAQATHPHHKHMHQWTQSLQTLPSQLSLSTFTNQWQCSLFRWCRRPSPFPQSTQQLGIASQTTKRPSIRQLPLTLETPHQQKYLCVIYAEEETTTTTTTLKEGVEGHHEGQEEEDHLNQEEEDRLNKEEEDHLCKLIPSPRNSWGTPPSSSQGIEARQNNS